MDTLATTSELGTHNEHQQLTDDQQRRIDDGLFTLRWSSENSETPESEIKTVKISSLHRSGRFKNGKKTRVDNALRDLEILKLIAMSTSKGRSNGRLVHAFILLETPDDEVVTGKYKQLFESEALTEQVIETVPGDEITTGTPERAKKQIGIRFLCDCPVFYDGTTQNYKQGQIIRDPAIVIYALRNSWPVVREDEPVTFHPCPRCAARHHVGLVDDGRKYLKATRDFRVVYSGMVLDYKANQLITDSSLIPYLLREAPEYLKPVTLGIDMWICRCGHMFWRDGVVI